MEKIFFQHCASLLSDLRQIRKDSVVIDVQIVCAGGEKVYTNSMILNAVSPLLSCGEETFLESESLCILLPDLSAQHVQMFLDKLLVWNFQPSLYEVEILGRIGSTFGAKSILKRPELENNSDAVLVPKEAGTPVPIAKPRKLPLRTIYQCDKCQKQFHLKRNFMHHINSHLGIKPYICNLCDKRFSQKSHLNTHMKIHTGVKPYICHKCGKAFSVCSNLKKHASIHCRNQDETDEIGARPKPIEIYTGNEEIITEKSKTLLMEEDNNAADGLLFRQEHQSVSKEDFYVVEESYQDSFRDSNVGTEGVFSSSKLVEEAEKVFACPHPHCSQQFSSRTELDTHKGSHGSPRKHSCGECGKEFTQKSHLNQHIRVKHTNKEYLKRYECDICQRRLTSNHSLKKHKMLHWNDKPYLCEMCDKSFVQKSHLDIHRLKHVGVKPHLCVECGKSFLTKGHLKEHMKNHSGERKVYQCLECNAQYFGFHDLQIHMRRHSGEAPFPCTTCLKRFRSKRNLDNHQRIHTGEKPFKCSSCQKTFTTSSALCQHFKKAPTCRGQLVDTTGAYTLKSRGGPKGNDGSVPEMKSCIILDCLDLSIPTVSLSPFPEQSVQKSVAYSTMAQGLKKETNAESEQESQVEPEISLPRIFLEN